MKKCFSEDHLKQFILDVNSIYRRRNKNMQHMHRSCFSPSGSSEATVRCNTWVEVNSNAQLDMYSYSDTVWTHAELSLLY